MIDKPMLQENPVLEYSSSGSVLGIDKFMGIYPDGKLEVKLTGYDHKYFKKVDLLTYKSIHPLLRDRILKEEVRIL